MITKLYNSPIKGKRFRAEILTSYGVKKIDFGSKGASTFIDGQSETVRKNYLKRHLANPIERILNDNLTPSPSVLSINILWGESRDIETNIKALNKRWKNK